MMDLPWNDEGVNLTFQFTTPPTDLGLRGFGIQ